MPASIQLSQLEIQWILNLVEKKFNISVLDSYSCQKLSDVLLDEKVFISYNTIRRLFGIISPKFQTSRYTLNLLLKELGFDDFVEFQTFIKKYKTDALNEVLIRYKATKKLDSSLLFESIQYFNLFSWEEAYQLKLIIDLCVETKNFELLKKVIELQFELEKPEVHHRLYVAYQGIYLNALEGNSELIDFVTKELPNSINLQKIILLTYVDEFNLSSFYGEWLIAVKTTKIPDFECFKNLMMCQRSFFLEDFESAKEFLKSAKFYLKSNSNLHPVLLGRISAWDLILFENHQTYVSCFKGLLQNFDKFYFVVFFYRILEMGNVDIAQFGLINEVMDTQTLEKLSVFEKQVINKLNLMISLYFDKKGASTESVRFLKKVDPRRFDVNDGLWFNEKHELLENKISKTWEAYL
jgi:hypothetical protein